MTTPLARHTHADDALSVTETAETLSVHPRTVWRYIAAGRLTALRHPMNRRVYICREEALAAQRAMAERVLDSRYRERPEINAT